MPRREYKFVKKYVEENGYKLKSDFYTNALSNLEMICPRGHVHVSNWNNFFRGNRCKKCYLEDCSKGKLRKIIIRQKYFNISEAARYLRVEDTDLRKHIKNKTINAPSHKVAGYVKLFYTESDLKKMDKAITKNETF